MERRKGLEPSAFPLARGRSTTELPSRGARAQNRTEIARFSDACRDRLGYPGPT